MVLILMSGGVDSTTLAHQAMKAGRLGAVLFIDYAQPAARMESDTVDRWAERHGVEVIHLGCRIFGVDESMRLGPGEAGLRILPGRNMVLLSHAVNVAKVRGFDEVWIGANADDIAYPDCREGWLVSMGKMTEYITGIRIDAPLIHMSKPQIIERGAQLGVDLATTWSCYEPINLTEPCGECHSCREAAPQGGE